jgi:two-component system nitrate/nitrite sensor histidine kinase NarX
MPVAAEVQYRYSHPTAAAPILPLSLPLPMSALPLPTTAKPDSAILAEITAGVSAGRDLPELLGRFLAPVMRLAGAQGGAVRLLDETSERLHLISQIALPPELCQGQASASRHCGHCGNAANQAAAAAPRPHAGRLPAVHGRAPEPSDDVRALLQMVGELLGLALNNARLEQQTLHTRLLQERQAMAAEVHDSLAQSLAVAKMRMPLLHDAMRAHDDERAEAYHDDVRRALSQAHASLRSIITHFRVPLDPRGLLVALATCAEDFRRSSGAELDFVNDWPVLRLPQEQEAQVFHIVQEALANMARHAAPSTHAWCSSRSDGDRGCRCWSKTTATACPRSPTAARTTACRSCRSGRAAWADRSTWARGPGAAPGAAGLSAPAAALQELMAAPRLVLVDDHALCRTGLSDLLRQRGGMDVVAALGDPEQLADVLREHKPDLLVLDLRMPSTDGLSLLRRIRAEGLDTPALILTMSDSEVDLSAALRAGVRGYLLKDMEPEDVVTAIGHAARGELTVAPAMTLKLAQLLQSPAARAATAAACWIH